MNNEKFYINLNSDVKDKLDKISKQRGIKTSELVRFILSDYILKNGDN